jgi:hypothetical protein
MSRLKIVELIGKPFELVSICLVEHDTGFGGFPWKVAVEVTVDAKLWKRHRERGELGQFYNLDIGNSIYREYGVGGVNPTVDDETRAKSGRNTIRITHYLRENTEAEKLGMKFKHLSKLGMMIPEENYLRIA